MDPVTTPSLPAQARRRPNLQVEMSCGKRLVSPFSGGQDGRVSVEEWALAPLWWGECAAEAREACSVGGGAAAAHP